MTYTRTSENKSNPSILFNLNNDIFLIITDTLTKELQNMLL